MTPREKKERKIESEVKTACDEKREDGEREKTCFASSKSMEDCTRKKDFMTRNIILMKTRSFVERMQLLPRERETLQNRTETYGGANIYGNIHKHK